MNQSTDPHPTSMPAAREDDEQATQRDLEDRARSDDAFGRDTLPHDDELDRDPELLMSHAGAHPVGAAVGAVGGAAAGAIAGIAAGPVGSLAGALVGGLAGAMLGSGQTASGPAEVTHVPTEDGQAIEPGDEAPPGTPGTGDNTCPRCGGTGLIGVDAQTCPLCGGRGQVVQGIGGA
jgi:hypothetical protein